MMFKTLRDVSLTRNSDTASETLAQISAGTLVEVLELAGSRAWCVVPDLQLVGYVDQSAIALDLSAAR